MHAKAVALLQTDDRRALDCCGKAIVMYTRMNSVLGLASAKEMMGKLKASRRVAHGWALLGLAPHTLPHLPRCVSSSNLWVTPTRDRRPR